MSYTITSRRTTLPNNRKNSTHNRNKQQRVAYSWYKPPVNSSRVVTQNSLSTLREEPVPSTSRGPSALREESIPSTSHGPSALREEPVPSTSHDPSALREETVPSTSRGPENVESTPLPLSLHLRSNVSIDRSYDLILWRGSG